MRFDLNTSGDIRLLESHDWSTKENSYFKDASSKNQNQLCRTMNGFQDPKDMIHLQVKGKNQLFKEIEETQRIDNKFLDNEALHRFDPNQHGIDSPNEAIRLNELWMQEFEEKRKRENPQDDEEVIMSQYDDDEMIC